MATRKKRRGINWATVAGGIAAAAVGVGMFWFAHGDILGRLSCDVPFRFQWGVPDELVMVYVDSNVKASLHEPRDQPLNRRYYARLLQKLKQDGARLVLFDILMDEPSSDPAIDQEFAAALGTNGPVVLVADYGQQLQGNALTGGPIPPLEIFTRKARWGLARLLRDKGDGAIRQLDNGADDFPSVSWVAAGLLKSAVPLDEPHRLQERWLNYYCPPAAFRSVNLDLVLEPDFLRPGYFKNKIVVIGSRGEVVLAGAAGDVFPTPRGISTGASIHALSLLNLLRGDWLVQMSLSSQIWLVLFWGLLIGAGLMQMQPWHAAWTAAIAVALIAASGIYCQYSRHVWWSWMIPAVVQTPFALVWSVGWQYALELNRKKTLRRAFGAYLSPYMAEQIANSDFNLELGGEEVEATVMFTDLEGFTKMSETLAPRQVSKILTAYFNETTRAILKQDGTIIKYIGDAVMAVWGAPLPVPDHAERAVLAAWGMHQAGLKEIEGRRLRTRIGVNTGLVLAGNLGSDFRFDYTLIGDTTNFASRLEGLNKYLGTDILISEHTRKRLSAAIKVRNLGRFMVVGKARPVGIFQVLGPAANFPQPQPWLDLFDHALEQFVLGEFAQAEKTLRQVLEVRNGKDGPAEFYLKELAKAQGRLQAGDSWDGVVVLDSK